MSAAATRQTRAYRPSAWAGRFSWALVGNVVYAACQWAMLAVLARLGSPAMVGEFALALAVCAPIILFLNLQLRNLQATDATGQYRPGDYLALRFATTTVFLVAVAAIVFGFGLAGSIVIVALAKAAESVSDVLHGYLQRHERMDRIAKSLISKGVFGLVGWTSGLLLFGTVEAAASGLFFGWALSLLVVDCSFVARTLKEGQERFDIRLSGRWRLLGALVLQALPLGLVATLISINTNTPRYIIEHYVGPYHLGIFAALAYLIVAGNMVAIALAQAASPRLARYYYEGDLESYRQVLGLLLFLNAGLGVAGILVAVAAGRPLLGLLYGAEYAAYGPLLSGIMVVGALGYLSTGLGAANTAVRCLRPQFVIELLVTMTTAGFGFLLVPRYGLNGAVMALLIGAAIKLGMLLALQIRIQRNRRKTARRFV